jgi:methionyl-tRNA formyltransferase
MSERRETVYFFTNLKYGLPVVRAALAALPEERPRVVVLSDRTRRPRRPRAILRWALAQRRLKAEARAALGTAPLLVRDVNAPGFRRRIRPGDAGLVAGFNQIFRAETIDLFDSLVNVHPSVMPLYRGPVPSRWCLRNGEARTGYTLHRITPEIDAGEILHQGVVEIPPEATEATLDQAIAVAAAPVAASWVRHLETGVEWRPATVDAHAVYETPLAYASFDEVREMAG